MKSKTEESSGGVIFRIIDKKVQILVLQDPKGKWTFPKGLIEKNEKLINTAIREIKEEVGVDKIEYIANLGIVKYVYTYKDTFVNKTVHYFLFELTGECNLIPQGEEGIQAVEFIDLEKAEDIIGYHKTNVPVLKKVKDFFQEKKVS